jgi:hypothetical protein
MAKQVIYRRGTTAEHANFVGANGEITVDTVKHVVIVHDGVTAGGVPLANASAVNASISSLTANAANQASTITVLQANAATQANLLTSLISNASVQQASIDAFILTSNATAIFANIAGVQANVTAANVQIGLLVGNATVQSEAIVLANANIIALQSGLTAANVAIAGFVAGSGFANLEQLTANITAVNSAISTQGTTFATNVAVDGIRANVTAANVAISALQANIAAANVAINNIALSPSLIAGVSAAVTSGNLIPTQANVYTLGTPEFPWNHLYVGTGSITIGNVTLSDDGGNISIQSSENDFAAFDNIYSISFGGRSIGQVGSILFSRSLSDENVRGLAINSPEFFELRSGNIWFGTGGGGNLTVVGNITVDNPGALQFLDSSAASFSVGSISSVGNIGFSDNTYQTTANIMLAAFTMSNHQQWTSNVSTIGAALNQLAARLATAGF